jgi:hypothetical protein
LILGAKAYYKCVLGALSLKLKQKGREAVHSLPSGAEVKTDGAITLLLYASAWHDA